MSDMSMNGAAPPPLLETATPEECVNALMFGIASGARKFAQATSAAEGKDWAQSALYLAQTLVIMDPELTADGVPVEHDHELEEIRQDGQQRLEEARQAAAAPKTKRVRKTADGFEMEG